MLTGSCECCSLAVRDAVKMFYQSYMTHRRYMLSRRPALGSFNSLLSDAASALARFASWDCILALRVSLNCAADTFDNLCEVILVLGSDRRQ